tara:strand:+ start:29896 stop:30507 length:612 start_codon:yes stop_codon:yes gene_type:complete
VSEQRQKQKRGEILAGAVEVFRLEGFEMASMDRIAEVSGVSKRTIYNHFGSKDALFQAVIEKLLEAVMARKQILWDPERSLESQLHSFALAKTSIVDDPQWLALVKVVLGIAIQQPERAKATMEKAGDGEAALVTWLEQAHAAGRMRVPDPALSSKLFWGMVAGTVFWPQIFEEPLGPEQRDALTNEVIATFLARHTKRSLHL